MHKRSDDRLIAYLDGELEVTDRRDVEAWLDSDPAARERLAALAESANLIRSAFDEVVHEPVPERLIAAARGETIAPLSRAKVVPFRQRQRAGLSASRRGWWMGLPVAQPVLEVVALVLGERMAATGLEETARRHR